MDENENKRLAKELMASLRAKSEDIELCSAAIKEFESESSEYRVAVAMGLLAIGGDRSENILYRNVMLNQLAMFVRTCGLRNNEDLIQRLNEVIDNWITTVPDRDFYAGPWGALMALSSVNRSAGLEKCESVIKFYGDSEAAHHLREVRRNMERLNRLEP